MRYLLPVLLALVLSGCQTTPLRAYAVTACSLTPTERALARVQQDANTSPHVVRVTCG